MHFNIQSGTRELHMTQFDVVNSAYKHSYGWHVDSTMKASSFDQFIFINMLIFIDGICI